MVVVILVTHQLMKPSSGTISKCHDIILLRLELDECPCQAGVHSESLSLSALFLPALLEKTPEFRNGHSSSP